MPFFKKFREVVTHTVTCGEEQVKIKKIQVI